MSEQTRSVQSQGRKAEGKSKSYFGLTSSAYYAALRERSVQIVTLDGKVYGGLLVGVDQYDIFIKQQSGAVVLIAKHAIKTVAVAG